MHELVLALGVLEPGLHPPRLEGFAVGAAGDFAIGTLRRQPDLEVVGLGCREAHVAGAQRDDAVGQLEPLQDGFGVADHFLERSFALIRGDDLHHFDLVELMLADHAAYVAPAAARFGAEAGAVCSQFDRQRVSSQYLFAYGVGQRDLGSGDEVLLAHLFVTATQYPEHVFLELG
ncbi:hypothetical protein SDC9_178393 [bioreactor metagenome]|uniref:Uncharacterized protein n=1 Tax=bioreactor metagenome TaxID=1076179 RepID=A0A645GXZ4_9ZZZZ